MVGEGIGIMNSPLVSVGLVVPHDFLAKFQARSKHNPADLPGVCCQDTPG